MTGREEEREEDEIERMVPFPAISQQSTEWTRLTRTQLERQYVGPFQDTAIQRWREPADVAICYLSVPISASRSVPNETGYVQYGANTIGSTNCFAVLLQRQRRGRVPEATRRRSTRRRTLRRPEQQRESN